jgi:hypothetical protein
LSKFQSKGQPENPNVFIVAVEGTDSDSVDFRFTQMGSALQARFPTNMVGLLASELNSRHHDESFGSLVSAYRHCARTLAPSYEFATYDFGDGSPLSFERLILPFRDAYRPVSHLLGLVLFDEGFWECQHGGKDP